MTDDELMTILDAPATWIVRGADAVTHSLRQALNSAAQSSVGGVAILALTQLPNDQPQVPPEQIHRLWKRLGIVSPPK